ncbi:hypothetical protein UFOVP466_18 [uncultured Caudovirales phage]|uniref:Uncharacterized protein n=1 Tax=uncultured Caudovirales phage TaxID=2100421 RepID=A0A6J5MFW5_9CAUD|nr:hypothetical protein UFOVP466_18 [uncultured Caudovirales phage]CAB4180629.1 hypothetical protein UFOVP1045_65 [uncultured Caudovirales phage]CAB4189901.1 hypothetical protein UFOVP1194_19 [uncultured Caudovirales phage]CAB4221778.1 hypothetical protein UFOVP1641_15 [uncultured Caudovirales phage]
MAANTKTPTASQVSERIGGEVTKRAGVFTYRRGFFYRNGVTSQDVVDMVKAAYPDAVVVDSGEVWRAFKGGASTAKSSHCWVTFTL